MDATSDQALGQLQGVQGVSHADREPDCSLTLVNVGISQQKSSPCIGEAWNPDGDSTLEKQGSKLVCEVYRNDVLVRFDIERQPPTGGEKRGQVKGASRESLNRLFLLANNSEVVFRSFSTLTVHGGLWGFIPVDRFKAALNAYLVKAKRDGLGRSYIWVREHQESGAPHYHVLHSAEVDADRGDVCVDRSRALSVWWAEQLAKGFPCPLCSQGRFVECESRGGWCGEGFRKMAYPRDSSFLGCTRIEKIRDGDNAGGYLSKECSKRLQKSPPALWEKAGRWWGASRDVKAKPIALCVFDENELISREVTTDQGVFDMVVKLQYGLGKRILSDESSKVALLPVDQEK